MFKVKIAHGKPTKERYENPDLPKPHEANWFPWIKEQLEIQGIETSIPAMPRPYYPVFTDWKATFGVDDIDRGTRLVGFSTGAEFLLRLLFEEDHLEADRLVLVAPWRDREGKYGDFSKYTLDPRIEERVGQISVITSRDDSTHILDNARALTNVLPLAKSIELDGHGHFLMGNNMTCPEFPELLAELLDVC